MKIKVGRIIFFFALHIYVVYMYVCSKYLFASVSAHVHTYDVHAEAGGSNQVI